MEIYRVAFIGHRKIEVIRELEERIEQIACRLIQEKEFVEFCVGRNGDFDILAASAIKRAQGKQGNHNSSLILFQPYPMKDDGYYRAYYDEVCYPVENAVHPKAAITKRNQWMIDHAHLVVAFVENGSMGGASSTLKYAQKRGVSLCNLAGQERYESIT